MVKFDIDQLSDQYKNKLATITSISDLELVKTEVFGRKGFITDLLKSLASLNSVEEKRVIGQAVNAFKANLELLFEEKSLQIHAAVQQALEDKDRYFDVTATTVGIEPRGSLHFYTQFYEEIENIFLSLGFQIFEGPEVETDFYNFTALNIGLDHPARDMYDTLWVSEKNRLLRTHTSSVQIRAMQKHGAPLAGISVGRVFRHEALDATHEVVFTQCEGLFIDKDVSLSNLFGIAKMVLQKLFNKKNIDIRVRPGFFPFVVPGIEIDMKCVFCLSGCGVCKKSTWIEVFPGGLVHPKVLDSGGIHSKVYSGYAFGFGVERLAMLRHQIRDIRLFKSGDMRFLEQF